MSFHPLTACLIPIAILFAHPKNDPEALFLAVVGGMGWIWAMILTPHLTSREVLVDACHNTNMWENLHAWVPNMDVGNLIVTLSIAIMCASFRVMARAIHQKSPFLVAVLYAQMLGFLLRDSSVVAYPKLVLLMASVLLGIQFRELYKIQVATACAWWFLMQQQQQQLPDFPPNKGAYESIALLLGIVSVLVHEILVRFLLAPAEICLLVVGFSASAFSVVETALELTDSTATPLLTLNSTWTQAMSGEVNTSLLALMSSVFCLCLTSRIVVSNNLTWIMWQNLLGVLAGTLVGLSLWSRFANHPFDVFTSPCAASIVCASLLARTSSMFPHYHVVGPEALRTRLLTSVFLVSAGSTPPAPDGNETYIATDNDHSSLFPHKLLTSYISSGFPHVATAALQAADAHRQAAGILETAEQVDPADPMDVAKHHYARALAAVNVSKFADELLAKMVDEIAVVDKNCRVLAQFPSIGAILKEAHARSNMLHREVSRALDYVTRCRAELAELDEIALESLANARTFLFEQQGGGGGGRGEQQSNGTVAVDGGHGNGDVVMSNGGRTTEDFIAKNQLLDEWIEIIRRRKKRNLQLVPVATPPTTSDAMNDVGSGQGVGNVGLDGGGGSGVTGGGGADKAIDTPGKPEPRVSITGKEEVFRRHGPKFGQFMRASSLRFRGHNAKGMNSPEREARSGQSSPKTPRGGGGGGHDADGDRLSLMTTPYQDSVVAAAAAAAHVASTPTTAAPSNTAAGSTSTSTERKKGRLSGLFSGRKGS